MTPVTVAVIGPESSGKTTLSRDLAVRLDAGWVPEAARDFLAALGRPYRESDLLDLARAQIASEDQARACRDRVVADTNLIVIEVWSQWSYGRVAPWITAEVERRTYDLTLLLAPDLPWTFDPLREHPDPGARQRIFDAYRSRLEQVGAPYAVVEGAGEERLACALRALQARTTLRLT